MKFTLIVATTLAMTASMVSAQDPVACTTCLQQALAALPACASVQTPTAGSVTTAYAACLCASLSGTWIDSCSGSSQCGSAISAFASIYAANIQAAGLDCDGTTASFTASA
ncbi:hypothetical protein BGZ79_007771 [Entomortierella chlamydospora]|nr:hypothetical protein BGZ79_007771 [Entomortierella chlamydospora]